MKHIRLKIILVLVFAILTVIFTIQNTDIVTVELYFWKINMPLALLILFSFTPGLVIGLFLTSFSKKNKKKKTIPDSNSSQQENIEEQPS